jgi:hypothetical protein
MGDKSSIEEGEVTVDQGIFGEEPATVAEAARQNSGPCCPRLLRNEKKKRVLSLTPI